MIWGPHNLMLKWVLGCTILFGDRYLRREGADGGGQRTTLNHSGQRLMKPCPIWSGFGASPALQNQELPNCPHWVDVARPLQPHPTHLSQVASWTYSSPGGADSSLLLPRWLNGKEPACHCRRCRTHGINPWAGKIPWRRVWQLTQYFCLENPLDREGLWAI